MKKLAARGFPKTEFQARFANAQKKLAEGQLDAMFLTAEEDFHYYTGLSS